MPLPIAQTLLGTERVQRPLSAGVYGLAGNAQCSLLFPGQTNSEGMYPGTADFCMEMWIRPTGGGTYPRMCCAWGSGGNSGGPAASNFSVYFNNDNFGGLYGIRFQALGQVSTTITAGAEANIFNSQWNHLAFSRSGTTLSLWWNGILYAELTDFNGDLSTTNVGSSDFWMLGGPTGDRDESYGFGISAALRNIRWTTGNSVYTPAYNITPPSLVEDIPAVTGTQWAWWPAVNNDVGTGGFGVQWLPDIGGANYYFQNATGTSSGAYINKAGYTVDDNYLVTPCNYNGLGLFNGTWTNNGTGAGTPVYGTGAITPIIGSGYADFTMSGTNVNISSTDSPMTGTTSYSGIGYSYFITLWFYVPGFITNECKNLIHSVNVANTGLCINIGRPGQDLDWLSICTTDDTERFYGRHIWARNAWNYVTIQQPQYATLVSAWAGAQGDSYATNLNLTATGGPYEFGNADTVYIGSKPGSAVSCQMYLGLVQMTSGYYNFGPVAPVYDAAQPTIPVQDWQYTRFSVGETFTFQGASGSSNIQPLGYV